MIGVNERYHRYSGLQKRVIEKWNFTYRQIIPFLDKYVRKNTHVLDVGSGVGTLDFYISSSLGCKVLGIEDSERAVKAAEKNLKRLGLEGIIFRKAAVQKLVLNRKFDSVLLIEVVEHIEDDISLLRKVSKLLQYGGILILSTPLTTSPLSRIGLSKYHDLRVGHVRRYSRDSLKRKIRASGFKILRCSLKTSILREFLFLFPGIGRYVVRLANRFYLFSEILSFVDGLLLPIFGPAQIILVAQKR